MAGLNAKSRQADPEKYHIQNNKDVADSRARKQSLTPDDAAIKIKRILKFI